MGVREGEIPVRRARAVVGVHEDRTLLVVRPRVGAGPRGPAAQRGVRDEGDALAGFAAAQAAAQRRAALRIGQRDDRATGVVAVAELLQDGRGMGRAVYVVMAPGSRPRGPGTGGKRTSPSVRVPWKDGATHT